MPTDASPFDFSSLRRRPDFEAPNLVAVDATDRLLLDEAATSIQGCAPGEIVVVGDHYGALTLGAASMFGASGIRTHQDPVTGELALAANADALGLSDRYESMPLDSALLEGARVVLMQLPRSLAELDEIAGLIARYAGPEVEVFAGGRLKHMTLTMNDVLAEHFGVVNASLSRQKSRVLVARDPRRSTDGLQDAGGWPRRDSHADLGLTVVAHGGAFAGTRIDIGTRALLDVLPEARPDAVRIVDLGTGTGVLAVVAARSRPEVSILASDRSAAAVLSARATADANGVGDRVEVVRDDALSSAPSGSADLVLLNPPFHVDAAVEPEIAVKLFEAAARVLRSDGELWTVFNSHLKHRELLERVVGPTRQVTRNNKFTVTASVKR